MQLPRISLVSLVFVLAGGCASSVSSGTSSGDARVDGAREGGTAGDTSIEPPVPDVIIEPPPPDVVELPDDGVPTMDVPTPPPDASTVIDSGFPVAPDGAVIYPPDAGYDPGVRCGTAVCTAAQECCPDRMTRALSCVAMGACMLPNATCDGPEDCPSSQRCCLGGVMGMRFDMSEVACHAASECSTIPLLGTVTVCHTNADCPASARRCCDVSRFGGAGANIPAGVPRVCTPLCPGG